MGTYELPTGFWDPPRMRLVGKQPVEPWESDAPSKAHLRKKCAYFGYGNCEKLATKYEKHGCKAALNFCKKLLRARADACAAKRKSEKIKDKRDKYNKSRSDKRLEACHKFICVPLRVVHGRNNCD